MKPKTSSELNTIILNVMRHIRLKYKADSRYKIMITGLKSASRALAEITTKEIENFDIDE